MTDGSILDEGTLYVAKFNADGTGEWLALTQRSQAEVDAANPRAENNFGQIVRWRYPGNEHKAATFSWDLFIIAGTALHSATLDGEALDDDNIFACPDGIWCDNDSRLWIQTDMGDIGGTFSGPLEPFGTNQMLAADPKTGEVRRFLTGPWGQEVTGVVTTPDQRTMFVNLQHPGAHASAEDFAAGHMGSAFPDGGGTVPRSATIAISREDGGVIVAP